MPDSHFDTVYAAIADARNAGAEDVRALRALFYGDGAIAPDEARRLIDLDQIIDAPGADWIAFFHETLTDYVVRQEEPRGYVNDAKARWLLGAIEADGLVKTASELELVVRILEAAESVPECLVQFVLEQVQRAVLVSAGHSPRMVICAPAFSAPRRSLFFAARFTRWPAMRASR